MKSIALVSGVVSLATLAQGQQYVYPDVLTLLSTEPSLSSLWSFLEGYMEVVNQYSHYTNITLVSPNNDAFTSFINTPSSFNDPSNRSILEAILEYHILEGEYYNVSDTIFAQTFLTPDMYTNRTGGQYVGVGPTYNGSVAFTSGLGQSSISVLEPIYFQGGVVWVTDRVMQVPLDVTSTTVGLNLTATSGALNKTELTTSLGTTWDVTIFAPSNAAFNAVGSAVGNMTAEELSRIMQYHILTGDVIYSSNFADMQLKTSQGSNITMTTNSDGSVFVNNARIVQPNILIENGVLHIIDNVMNPSNSTANATSTKSGVKAFGGATSTGEIPFTNVPLASISGSPVPLNTTTPSPAAAATPSSSSHRHGLSGGAIAAIVLGLVVGIAFIAGGTCIYFKARGYRVKVARRSIIISPPILNKPVVRYELPPEGGRVEKVELPTSEESTVTSESPGPPDFLDLEDKFSTSDEKSDSTESRRDPPSPSPLSPHEGIWELSADEDVRQRIEKFLKPKETV